MQNVKSTVQKVFTFPITLALAYVRFLKHLRKGLGFSAQEKLETLFVDSWGTVAHQTGETVLNLTFLTPNRVCDFRVETFATKEPETLAWIDKFGGEGAFYDVGANVGLYSVYYAKRHTGNVYAFEPSVFNLSLLARNAAANEVGNRIVIVPTPLTANEEISQFRLTSTQMGAALSSFGLDVGFDGNPIQAILEYTTLGVSLDFLVRHALVAEPPVLLKIDVDGIEPLILRGASEILDSPSLKSVLIEVNNEVKEFAQLIESSLHSHGFELVDVVHGSMFNGTKFSSIGNQIWIRRPPNT